MPEAIDVRDGTPEALIDVLVFGSLADEAPEWHLGCQRTDGRWQLTDSEPLALHGVTHWMPLPPDPRPSGAAMGATA